MSRAVVALMGVLILAACSTPAAPLEPAAVACHDIVTHMEHNLAGAACAEQGQVWEVDPDTGIPDTEHPMLCARCARVIRAIPAGA